MTKKIPAIGVKADGIEDLFKRNGSTSRFRGLASFGDACVLLEVADTPELLAKGMMGRASQPECCGMLFTGLTGGAFWMKNCLIPLDIVFLDDFGRITRMYGMEADDGVRRYPYGDEKTAIELVYGFCDRHGVSVGDEVKVRVW